MLTRQPRRTAALRALLGMLLVLGASKVFAQGMETDGILAAIRSLYSAAGRVMPTVSLPVSRGALVVLAQDIASDSPSEAIADRASELVAALSDDTSIHISTAFSFVPEYYYGIDRSQFSDQLRAEDPFARLRLGYGLLSGAYLYIEGSLYREWSYSDEPMNIPPLVEGNPLGFENDFVTQGYLFLPVGPADITFGRQHISLGPDPENTLYVSSLIPYLDALRVTMRLGGLKMTSLVSSLENGRAASDPAVSAAGYGFDVSTILYNIHYFEYSWRHVRVGIGAQDVVARPYNSFQLGDFFPVFSWHNADFAPNNMSLVGDVTVEPLPGVSAFLQIGFDDINGTTVGVADSGTPTIDAYIGGASYRLPWFDANASFVGGYTHYLWGNFEDANYLARAIYRMESDGPRRSMPLTSPYGPGALWFESTLKGAWNGLGMGIDYLALGKLPDANLTSTSYAASEAIANEPRDWTHTVTLDVSYSPWRFLSLRARPGLAFDGDGVHPRLELSAETSIGSDTEVTR